MSNSTSSASKKPTAQEKRLEVQAITSKIKGVTGHLDALLQKRNRLDIEIRKVRLNLKALTKCSKALAEDTSWQENRALPIRTQILLGSAYGISGPDVLLSEINEATAKAEARIQEVEDLYKET